MIIPCNDADERLEGEPKMGLLGHRQCSTSLLLLELKMRSPCHQAITKQARKTNPIERFNNTLWQRLERLVRNPLSFSKKVENHIGAIQFFICHYHLEKAGA